MYCNKCQEHFETGKYCSICGSELSVDNVQETIHPIKDSLKIIITILSVLLCFYIVVGVPLIACDDAPDVIGGLYILIGPFLYFPFCIPIIVSIIALNAKSTSVIP